MSTEKTSRIKIDSNSDNGNLVTAEYPIEDPDGTDGIFIRILQRRAIKADSIYVDKNTATIIRDYLDKFINLPDIDTDEAEDKGEQA